MYPSARQRPEDRGPGKGKKRRRARRAQWQGEWKEATKARLFYGYSDWVLLDLEGMKPGDEEAGEEIRKLWGYLKENQGRVKYRALRRKVYPSEVGV